MGGNNKVIDGTVVKGLGEGAYFMSMGHYKKEIKDKLGFDAYPGTLNVKVSKKQTNLLKEINSIKIKGYTKNNKKFGGVSCYKAKINNINGSVIIPDINKHKKNIIEFISTFHIKSKLNLRNGDKIRVELI